MNLTCLLSVYESAAIRCLSMTHSSLACTTSWSRSNLYLARCASSRVSRRLEKLGIGPDGKPLPTPNVKKVFPRMYKVLMVNQDGSTYTVNHRDPLRVITLPLDLSTLSPEQLQQREKAKQASKARVYVQDKDLEDETLWDQRQYRKMFKQKKK